MITIKDVVMYYVLIEMKGSCLTWAWLTKGWGTPICPYILISEVGNYVVNTSGRFMHLIIVNIQ